ncbi:MAG: hypothetical protein A2Z14_14780 [Chloroflexi bacterium RBG_16_48_8]|nr:MAG: hypothetical protein A2Z14_14780 [Chloroflexi bacterium RBG_16_48_8]
MSTEASAIPQFKEISSPDPVLEIHDLTKRFPGVLANDHISFEVRAGETHGLLGENGAGKSTLAECIFGYYKPDSGSFKLNGNAVSFDNPTDALHAGIGMVHQHFSLIESFTVLENVLLGYRPSSEGLKSSNVEARFTQLLEVYGVHIDIDARVSQLSVGELQWVEILKALIYDVDLLILDEPTAVLTPQETDRLFQALERMLSEGVSIILITHKLREVMEVTDRVTVLRRGKLVGTVNTEDVTMTDLSRMMVGREIETLCRSNQVVNGDPVLEVQGLRALNDRGQLKLKNVNFTVSEGEILGLAGVSGNGQKELFEVLVGVRRGEKGEIIFDGKNITGTLPNARISFGIGYIPDDRQRTGLVGGFSIGENLILGRQWEPIFRRGLFTSQDSINKFAKESIAAFEIDSPSHHRLVRQLSGGNQQKVIIARETSKSLRLLLANQPTRGLDVGAIEYVTRKLLELRDSGVGILLASEDLEELMNLSDRIAVIFKGEIVDIIPCADANIIEIGLLMSGAKSGSQ